MRTLIIGANDTGELILRDLLKTRIYPYSIIGFVDDNPALHGVSLHGYRVLGGTDALPEIIGKHRIDKLLIAIPDISGASLRKLVDLCADHHVRFKLVPSYAKLVSRGDSSPMALKDVQLEDLLDRSPVEFDRKRISEFFSGKTILVTGAAGSIGSEICRQVADHGASRIIALDINENDLYFLRLEMQKKGRDGFRHRDSQRARPAASWTRCFPSTGRRSYFTPPLTSTCLLMESCPAEALKNNVLGTYNTASSALEHGAEHFVLISSDKAVNPTNVMGASKSLAEQIISSMAGRGKTRFMAVRFGNVLGSNGSLIPILRRQIEAGGPVTITHREITRFFMTIPEAVGLVLIAAAQNEAAVCVLDMGNPVSVDALAREMISLSGLIPGKDIEIVYTGLRPGEKMTEELFDAVRAG